MILQTATSGSDLYSLGCTVYFLLTGRVPFPGGTALEKIVRHQVETPAPLSQQVPALPPRVIAIVEQLMADRPKPVSRRRGAGPVLDRLADGRRDARGQRPRDQDGRKCLFPQSDRIMHWFLFFVAGVLGGLILALLLRQPWTRAAGTQMPRKLSSSDRDSTAPPTFVVERTGDSSSRASLQQ